MRFKSQSNVAAVFIPTVPNRYVLHPEHSPLILLWLHTRITVHAHTAAQQRFNGHFEARMFKKFGEWRD